MVCRVHARRPRGKGAERSVRRSPTRDTCVEPAQGRERVLLRGRLVALGVEDGDYVPAPDILDMPPGPLIDAAASDRREAILIRS